MAATPKKTPAPPLVYEEDAQIPGVLESSGGAFTEVFNPENPYSFVNKLPKDVAAKVIKHVDRNLLGMDENELRELIKPSPTINNLRKAWWFEYDRACASGYKMVFTRIYSGICTEEAFWTRLFKSKVMAWFLTPMTAYSASMEESLDFAISQMRKMLDSPLYENDGRLNTATANVILKIYKELDQRVHGSIVQKIETKNLSVHKHMGKDNVQVDTSKSLDKQIEEMQSKLIENRKIVEVDSDKEES